MGRLASWLLLCLLVPLYATQYVAEAPDGSVCFNNCNNHGDCVDYTCRCWLGYHGDDCGTTFVSTDQEVVPILTAGHFNLTRKNFTSAVTKNRLILIGFSAYSCHRCINVESEYKIISNSLLSSKIPFARVDADRMKSIALEHEASELPALVLFHKHRPLPYKGSHTAEAVMAFVNKQTQKPAVTLKSVLEVNNFLTGRNSTRYSTSVVMVVGFFSDHLSIEEDDFEDFMAVAKDLQIRDDVYFAVVTNPAVCEDFKKEKMIDRTPSMLLFGDNGMKSINLDELYGEKIGVKEWINNNAISLVGKLTNSNFKLYEKIPNPMLMLFLDLSHEHLSRDPSKVIGGRSGKILNEDLMEEFRQVAKEHSSKITFVYLDGVLHEDRMKSLGLYGGKERLPSLAFNTRENLQIPFPEELPINRDTLLQFCANFLSGKLKSAFDTTEMAKKVMQSVRPVNPKNKASRKERKTAPKEKRGISEQYDDGSRGDLAVQTVTLKNFDDVVMDEGKDVMLLLHDRGSEACSHFAVYYKHMALRFRDLKITSLVIARMDITDESPPTHMGLVVGNLPLVIMLSAGSKIPPWTFYSGVGKVAPLMKWAQEHATIKFELPNLPHLTEEQVVLYKEQVREREEGLETARREDRRAMANEDRARKEMERIKRNKLKRSAAVLEEGPGSQESIPDTLEAEVRPVAEVETDVKVQVHAEELDSRHEDEGNRDSLRRKRGLNSFTSEDDDSNEEL